MTIVAVWLTNHTHDQSLLECIADSRVTDEDSNHTISQLLNNSAKIFSIPVVARCPGETGEYDTQYYVDSFGLAFSGSSLIGLNLASTISSLTSQLVGRTREAIPSFQDIADFAVRITRKYVDAIGQLQGRVPPFKGAIFGWCHGDSKFKLLSFGPVSTTSPDVFTVLVDLTVPDSVFLMGNHTEEIADRIREFQQRFQPSAARDVVPQNIIWGLIYDRIFEDIGGELQHGRGSSKGFFLYPNVRSVLNEDQQTFRDQVSFRGLDLYDDSTVGSVGPCRPFF